MTKSAKPKLTPIEEQIRVIDSYAKGAGLAPPCEIPCGVIPADVQAGVAAHYQGRGFVATWVERPGPNATKAHLLKLAASPPPPAPAAPTIE